MSALTDSPSMSTLPICRRMSHASFGLVIGGAHPQKNPVPTFQPIPEINAFQNEVGSDNIKETIEANYRKVKQEILSLVDSEIQRIKNTPCLVSSHFGQVAQT